MSTLYEALKKAEKTQQTQNGLHAQGATQAVASGKSKRDIPVVLIVALVLLFAFSVLRAISMFKADASAKKKSRNGASAKMQAATPPVASQQAVAVKKTYTGHELEGIICNGDSCVAVINGKLLKLQDTIDSLIVKKISPQSVELSNPKDESTTILELK